MAQTSTELGQLNSKAPAELANFAFLIGRFQCEAKVLLQSGTWQTFQAEWKGRYFLDGYAIEDEYRMTDSSGALIVLGMNYRTYDPARKAWNIKWLNALAGTWLDLGSPEFGGVRIDDPSITYIFREPMAGHTFTRATYTKNPDGHFSWRGERSEDGKTWILFMSLKAHRVS
jgi:hypothetical protein